MFEVEAVAAVDPGRLTLPRMRRVGCDSITFPRHGATTPTHPRTPRSPESQLPSLESDKLAPRD
jgi:hypothetical protein